MQQIGQTKGSDRSNGQVNILHIHGDVSPTICEGAPAPKIHIEHQATKHSCYELAQHGKATGQIRLMRVERVERDVAASRPHLESDADSDMCLADLNQFWNGVWQKARDHFGGTPNANQ